MPARTQDDETCSLDARIRTTVQDRKQKKTFVRYRLGTDENFLVN